MAKSPKPKFVERKIYFYKFTCMRDGEAASINEVFNAYVKKSNRDSSKLIE